MDAHVTLSDAENEPGTRAILDGLIAHNVAAAGAHGYRPLHLLVRPGPDSDPIGGLTGYTFFGWLFVAMFFLPPALRGQGLGQRLLKQAEAEATARGCIGVYLDTFSFQARPFYEAQGYRVFGMLEDTPPGHSRFFMSKRLDGVPSGSIQHVQP